jgi:hypothetical protein
MSYPDLARLFFRVTGAFASAAWFNGLVGYNFMLFMIVHVVILSAIPSVVVIDVQTSTDFLIYFVGFPLFALGYILLGTATLHMLKLAQLIPLGRYFVREFNTRPPRLLLVILNIIGWAATAILPSVLYEAIFLNNAVLAISLAIAIPAAVWIIWALVWAFGLPDGAIFGWRLDEKTGKSIGDESAWRTFGFFGGFHIAQNLVVGLVVYFYQDWTAGWIAALSIWGLELIVALVLWFVSATQWKRPPRTGYVDNQAEAQGTAASTPLLGTPPTASSAGPEEETAAARFSSSATRRTGGATLASLPLWGSRNTGGVLAQKHD